MPKALDLAGVGEDLALQERVILMAAHVEERPEPGAATNERDRSSFDLETANLSHLELVGRAQPNSHRISTHR